MTVGLLLTSCVMPFMPIPAKSVDKPFISGLVANGNEPAVGIEVLANYSGDNACEKPDQRTLTDMDGKFQFEGEMDSITWIGLSNNMFISLCFEGPHGSREKRITAHNEPKAIILNCNVSIKSGVFCSHLCEGGWENRC